MSGVTNQEPERISKTLAMDHLNPRWLGMDGVLVYGFFHLNWVSLMEETGKSLVGL